MKTPSLWPPLVRQKVSAVSVGKYTLYTDVQGATVSLAQGRQGAILKRLIEPRSSAAANWR